MPAYTTFWKRFAAGLIDLFFFGIIFSIVASVLILLIRPQSAGQVILIYLFVCLSCYILLEAFWFFFKAAPGKLILKIQIVDAASGGKPGIGKLLLRGILYPVSLLPAGFGFWWILIDSRRQAAHDKLSGIVVINKLKKDESLKDKIRASASELDLKRFALMKIVMIVCAIFLLLAAPSFLYLLGTDVPITDEAREWFYEDKKETIPVEENAFYLVAGFHVPADMDPIQTGVTWTEEENARIEMLKINPSQPLPEKKIPEDPIISEIKESVPRIKKVSIVKAVLDSTHKIEGIYDRSQFLTDRYARLAQLTRFETSITPYQGAQHSLYPSLVIYQRLQNAWIIIQYDRGNHKQAIDKLKSGYELSRNMLKEADCLLAKLVFSVLLRRQLKLLNILLDMEGTPAPELYSFIKELQPLSQEELSLRKALRYEGLYVLNSQRQAKKRIDWKPHDVIRASILYMLTKNNSTANVRAESFLAIARMSEMSGADFMQVRGNKLVHTGFTDYVRNFPGILFLTGATDVYISYAEMGFYSSGYITLLKMKADILESGKQADEVLAYLSEKKKACFNIFTGEELEWDTAKNQLFFSGPNQENNEDLGKIHIKF